MKILPSKTCTRKRENKEDIIDFFVYKQFALFSTTIEQWYFSVLQRGAASDHEFCLGN